MHQPTRPLALISIAAVVAASSIAVGSFGGSVADGADPTTPVTAPRQVALAARTSKNYWTPARLAAAKPMVVHRDDRNGPRVKASKEVGRKTQRIAAIGSSSNTEGRVVKAATNQPTSTYPYPFGRRTVENPLRRLAPYRQVGRIFFRQHGVKYSCSGASVVGGPRQVVFTAGHCLNDGLGTSPEHWSTDVIFIPGRRTGRKKNPYGIFRALNLWVPQGWSFDTNYAYDMGAFNVKRGSKGKKLHKAVGALGFAYNEGRVQHWDSFGYPAQSPFNGNRLTTCSSQWALDDGSSGTDPIGIGCDMNGGSSGGPWILRLRRGNLLNGIVSYSYIPEPAALYGPYFDNTANNLRCAAATLNKDATSC